MAKKPREETVPEALPVGDTAADPIMETIIVPVAQIEAAAAAEEDTLKKHVWERIAKLKDRLSGLGHRRVQLQRELEDIRKREEYAEAQFKCLRGFVGWEKAEQSQRDLSAVRDEKDREENDRLMIDLRKAKEVGPQ